MRIFVYEAITAGAMHVPGDSLLTEGLAMLRVVTEDFAAIDGAEVWGLRDARLADFQLPRQEVLVHSAEEERDEFQQLANLCDWALIIAPELDGMLEERVAWLQESNAKLLSPSGEFLTIAASKSRTAQQLGQRGVPVPVGAPPLGGFPIPPEGGAPAVEFPLVLKRDDGAGSVGMRLITNRETLTRALSEGERGKHRLERFCPGLPVSVAVMCGPAGNIALQPCEQRLDPKTFEYLEGSTPLEPHHASRAKSLALAAIAAMPPTAGYVGVDLVLGEPADGSQDVVIEINPRLTTSYVGLRQACKQNLARAMLDVASGRTVDLSFQPERVEFRSDGCRLMV